jgi:sulfite dehydrogenase
MSQIASKFRTFEFRISKLFRISDFGFRISSAAGLCSSVVLFLFLLALSERAAFAAGLKIELPAETASFKTGPGSDLANGQCLTCHSVDYVVIQPPSPRAYWESSVKKMREKYGASIPDDQVEPLVNYLTQNYGPANSAAPSNTVVKASSAPTEKAASGEAVAGRYGCLSCHNVNMKIVGPAYKEIAAKYRGDGSALAKISEQIHKGGSGKWGPVLMPPFPGVTEAETKALADWILSQK